VKGKKKDKRTKMDSVSVTSVFVCLCLCLLGVVGVVVREESFLDPLVTLVSLISNITSNRDCYCDG